MTTLEAAVLEATGTEPAAVAPAPVAAPPVAPAAPPPAPKGRVAQKRTENWSDLALPFAGRPALLQRELAADAGFDPLSLADSKVQLYVYREAELKHARLAMLAAAGWPLAELWDTGIAKTFGLEPIIEENGGRAVSVLNGAAAVALRDGRTMVIGGKSGILGHLAGQKTGRQRYPHDNPDIFFLCLAEKQAGRALAEDVVNDLNRRNPGIFDGFQPFFDLLDRNTVIADFPGGDARTLYRSIRKIYALDPETRWQMQSLLLEIVRKERTTVLLVSHDIEEALYLGDVVFFLSSHPGRLRETIRPGFKASLGGDREAMLEHPEYRQLDLHIRRMMSDEGRCASGPGPRKGAKRPAGSQRPLETEQ